jgi:hypothetical protein
MAPQVASGAIDCKNLVAEKSTVRSEQNRPQNRPQNLSILRTFAPEFVQFQKMTFLEKTCLAPA